MYQCHMYSIGLWAVKLGATCTIKLRRMCNIAVDDAVVFVLVMSCIAPLNSWTHSVSKITVRGWSKGRKSQNNGRFAQ